VRTLKESIFQELKSIIADTFEVDENEITLSSRLYEDLDLDSIDAIDLVIKVQDYIGARVQPEDFKSARTVEDVINMIIALKQG
jgi:acyl carrier protein